MKTEEFIDWLKIQKNPEKIEGMENYMRNKFKFLGLQAAERRKLARNFINKRVRVAKNKPKNSKQSVIDWDFLFTLWEQPEREFQLIGIDYLKRLQKDLVLEDLSSLRKLVEWKSWWDTVDFLSKNIGAIVVKEFELTDEMRRWSLDESIWIRRVSILHQLGLKEETNKKLLNDVILNNIYEEEFFIRKAIGWALREYAKTDEEWVREFAVKHKDKLSPLSFREATKNLK